MNARKNSPQVDKSIGVYSNISDIGDYVIVEMDNGVSFKVTRINNSLTKGKYNLKVWSGFKNI